MSSPSIPTYHCIQSEYDSAIRDPEAHALNFDQRLNTIRQSLATADGHTINLNQHLNTFDESFTAVEGKITTIS